MTGRKSPQAEKGSVTVQKIDRVLWERELNHHMSQHPDLHNVPGFAHALRDFIGHLLLVVMLCITLMAAGVFGWLIGLHLI
ncbi:MAG TPA: hypothetical protein VIY28_06115 [Pseudonocardiaceae bacterium]